MSNVVQFRRSTAILTLVAASIGGGLIAAFAVASHSNTPAPVSVVARADTSNEKVSQLSSSFADIIEKASPAVVTISSTRVIKASEQQKNNPFTADPFFRQFFGGPNARPRDQREHGLGSGVIVSPTGYILTNNHVVDKATSLKVGLSDGRDFTAKVIGADPQTDLAVVKITANDLPTLAFANSDGARVGDLCFAIGNPFHQDHTVTMGIVSAKGRQLPGESTRIQNFIQTDAAINPGNSGGALINAQGRLIGINTMILTGGGSSMFGGEGGNIGIGFAVPANMAKQVMDQIEKTGKVSRGYMGALLGNLTPDLAPQFGLKDAKGALISQVTPGGPAEKAGLKMGDVVTAINGKPVNDANDLTLAVISQAPGSTVKLDVVRDSKPKSLTVTLGERQTGLDWDKKNNQSDDNDNDNSDDTASSGSATVRGIAVQNLTPEIADQVSVPAGTKGVVITDVDQGSPAADAAGIGRGVIIIAVDRKPVTNVSEFRQYMNEAKGKAVLLTLNAGGQTGFTVVQPQ
ncbi:MAG TPA: Do family serine endopeptidase [Bryobacteraceae bacterium]